MPSKPGAASYQPGFDVPHAWACFSRTQLPEVLRSLRDNIAPENDFDAAYLTVVSEAAAQDE